MWEANPKTCLVLSTFVILSCASVNLAPALAQCEVAKLLPPNGSSNDYFGRSVAVSGNVAVVGAPEDSNDSGVNCGSAYVFCFDGSSWAYEQMLLPSDGVSGGAFGYSVAICGDTLVVGAYNDDDNGLDSGSAYAFGFDGSNWVQQAKLVASDGAALANFGCSVDVNENIIIIGAEYQDVNGAAYMFSFDGSNWNEEYKLMASDGAAGDYFGCSVAIDANTVIIGAYADGPVYRGSAYLFGCGGSSCVQQRKIRASDGARGYRFGYSVGISGGTIVVGATNDDNENGDNAGAAYVFRGTHEIKLLASDGGAYDNLGWSVSIDGNNVIVGAIGDNDNGNGSGSAYLFRCDGNGTPTDANDDFCVEQAKLLPHDGQANNHFGYCVSIGGSDIIIGTQRIGYLQGSAYVFDLTGRIADFDNDCYVDFYDFAVLASTWLTEDGDPRYNPICDISDPKDDAIDYFDLDVFCDNWLAGR